jgi:hypothetical protein
MCERRANIKAHRQTCISLEADRRCFELEDMQAQGQLLRTMRRATHPALCLMPESITLQEIAAEEARKAAEKQARVDRMNMGKQIKVAAVNTANLMFIRCQAHHNEAVAEREALEAQEAAELAMLEAMEHAEQVNKLVNMFDGLEEGAITEMELLLISEGQAPELVAEAVATVQVQRAQRAPVAIEVVQVVEEPAEEEFVRVTRTQKKQANKGRKQQRWVADEDGHYYEVHGR